MIKRGAEIKRDEINEAGGINGKKLQIIFEDDAGDEKQASSIAKKFGADKSILAVIGHFNSNCTLAGKNIYAEAGVVNLTPGSTNVKVCEGSDWAFRNIYRDDFQGIAIARYIKNSLKNDNVVIFFENDNYGAGLKDAFEQEAEKIGLKILTAEPFVREDSDFKPQLTNAGVYKPKIIFIAGLYREASLIVSQARDMGFTSQFIGGDGLFSDDFLTGGLKAVEGTLLTVPFVFELGGEKAQALYDISVTKYGEAPDCWTALTYDAVSIVADAIREKGEDRKAIRDKLASMNSPEKAYPGITGATYFDKNGDCNKPIQVAIVRDGKFLAAPIQITK
jgi:branched-chain amino acid transport system substrate-binding protein